MPSLKVQIDGKWYSVGGLTSTQKKALIDEANAYANSLKSEMEKEITELDKAIKDTDEYIDGAFLDGIITELEAKTIATHLVNMARKKTEMDREYLDIFGNVYIDEDSKASLTSAKMNFDDMNTALINEINTAIDDAKGTPEELVLIDKAFLNYNQSLALLISALNHAIDQIGASKDEESYGNMVDHVTGTIAPINTKVLAMESEISQTAEQILLRVTKDELVTSMGNVKSEALEEANKYAEDLKTASDTVITELAGRLKSTEEYVDGAFLDGIVTSLEASGIATYINDLNTAKATFDMTYTDLYSNVYLKGAYKTNLSSAKTNLNTAHSALVKSIEDAIQDSVATPSEASDVDARFATYSDSVAVYSLRVSQGTDSIAKEKALEAQANAKDYTDGVLVPVSEKLIKHESSIDQLAESILLKVSREEFDAGIGSSTGYADTIKQEIETSIEAIQKAVTDTSTYIDEAFRDGIIYEAEYKKIQAMLLSLAESKVTMDTRYTAIYSNTSLVGTPKTNLASAKSVYDTRYTTLINTINSVIEDQLADSTESEAVNTAFLNYNNSIALLSSSLETAVDEIVKSKSAKALEDAKAYTNGVKSTLEGLVSSLDSDIKATDDYIDNAFKDGIVTEEEAKRISSYLNIVGESKGNYDQKYTEVHTNPDLSSTYKSQLGTAKTAYDAAYKSLVDTINLAIADGKSTPSEANAVDTQFKKYNLASMDLTARLEKALDNIARNLAAKALADAEDIILPIDNRLKSAEATILLLDDAIRLRVTQEVFDQVKGRVDLSEAQILVLANEISSKVTSEFVRGEIDKIEVGSTNLMTDSATEWSTTGMSSNSAYGIYRTGLSSIYRDFVGKDLTISFDIKADVTDKIPVSVRVYGSNSTPKYQPESKTVSEVTGEWKRKSVLTTITEQSSNSGEGRLEFFGVTTNVTKIYIKNLKIEAGNKPTAWSPAPQDVNLAINGLSRDLGNLTDSLIDLDEEINTTFKDGLITEAEALSIGKYTNLLNSEKANLDTRYNTIYADSSLSGTPKTELNSAKTAYNSAHTNLLSSISSAISDGATTTTESANVTTKFGLYNTALSTLSKAFETAITNIAQSKANTALFDAKAFTNAEVGKVNTAIDGVNRSVSELNTSINTTFKDGIIEESEAVAIATYINALANEKVNLDNRYSTVYADGKLSGTPKTDLNSKKTAYDTAHSNLISAINTAIADGKTTETESANVNSKFALYSTAVGNLSISFENAINSIASALANSALFDAKAFTTTEVGKVNTAISNVSKSVSDLNTTITTTFKDGIIEESEAKAITKYINALNTEKASLDTRFTTVYADTSLSGTPKTDLNSKKIAYNTAHTNLLSSINSAIADKKTTVAEAADVDAKFALYSTALSNLSKSFETAISTIAQKKADDALFDAKTFTTTEVGKINTAISNVTKSVTDLNTSITTTFKDGIIEESEAKSIAKYINALSTEKTDLDNRYTTIYADASLSGTPKTDLNSKKTAYNTAHSALILSINNAIADGKTTTAESTDVNSKFTAYSTALGSLSVSFETAISSIAQVKATKALTDANGYTNGKIADVNKAISDVSLALTTYKGEIDTTFKDGVITEAEAISIGKYANTLNSEKSDIDSRFSTIYGDPSLSGSPKTDLNSKKTLYNTAHTNLINSINTAIADKKTTTAESADVNSKFTAYSTALANLSKSFEGAITSIAQKKVDDLKAGYVDPLISWKSSAEQLITADAITSTVKSSQEWATQTSNIGKIQSNLDNLEIGGTNMLRDTALTHSGLGGWAALPTVKTEGNTNYVSMNYSWGLRYMFETLKAGTYTISVMAREVTATASSRVRFSMTDNNYMDYTGKLTADWKVYQHTFTATADIPNFSIYFLNGDSEGSKSIDFCKFQLEKGNKRTDWSPAIEDVSGFAIGEALKAENNAKLDAGWVSEYNVNISTPMNLVHPDGSSLSDAYTYECQARTTNTGTESTAIAIFRSKGDGNGWEMEIIYEQGTGSNHPKFILDSSGKPTITTMHTSKYAVEVHTKRVRGRESISGTLTKRISSAEVAIKSDSIISTVTSSSTWANQTKAIGDAQSTADTVGGKLDSLKIGGTNLALDTNSTNWESWGAASVSSSNGTKTKAIKATRTGASAIGIQQASKNHKMKLENGEDYIISFKIRGTVGLRMNYVFIMNINGTSGNQNISTAEAILSTTSYQTMSMKFKKNSVSDFSYIMISTTDGATGTWFEVEEIKVEKGNLQATDWTPAPEDIDSLISTAQSSANDANASLTDIMSDLKITPVEKSTLRVTWDKIKAEYTQLLAMASSVTVPSTTFTTAYNALNSTTPRIQTDILANMTTTYTLTSGTVRDNFKNQLNNYFVEAEKISKAISDKINGVANTANTTANTLKDVTLPALVSRVSTAEQKITADAIVGTVTSSSTWSTQALAVTNAQATADTATTKIDNLQVGGKNLMSGTSNALNTITSAGWGSYPYGYIPTTPGQEHTASVYIEAGTQDVGIRFIYKLKSGAVGVTESSTSDMINAGFKGTVSLTAISVPNAETFTVQFRHSSRDTPSNTIKYKEYKIEKGNRPTDWTPSPEDVDSVISGVSNEAAKANKAITDMSTDGTITPVEKVQLQKEWAVIKAEKVQLDATADAFGITAEKASLKTAYDTLNGVLATIFSNMKVNSTVTAATFRGQYDDFYDKKATLQRKVSETARTIGLGAQTSADNVLGKLDNLQVGGRNLLKNSGNFTNTDGWHIYAGISSYKVVDNKLSIVASSSGSPRVYNTTLVPLRATPVEYRITVEYIGSSISIGGKSSDSLTAFNEVGGQSIGAVELLDTINLEDNRKLRIFKWVSLPNTTTLKSSWIWLNIPVSTSVEIINVKIEEGNISTDWTPAPEDVDALIKTAQEEANKATKAITDMSTDGIITPVEKVQLQKEWATIKADKVQLDLMADTFSMTTEKASLKSAYDTLNSALSTIFSNMKANSTVTATTFRAQFDDFYDKKAVLQRRASELARGLANAAQIDANDANSKLGDIMSDLKITAVEKSTLKLTWDEIQAKHTNLYSLATSLGVPTATYLPTYTALNTTTPRIQTDILANMTTTYSLTTATRDSFKAQMNAFFVQYEALNKAVSAKVNDNAGTAQSGVNDLVSDLKITPLEKSELSRTWEIIKAQYGQLNAQALALGVSSTLRTEYTNAYNVLNSTTPRIQTDILASMTSTYTLTTATRDSFKSQITTYQTKAQEISKAITDKLNDNNEIVKTTVEELAANVGNLVNNPVATKSSAGWSDMTMTNQVFEGVSIPVMQSISTGSTVHYTDYFNADPSKAYEVAMWFKKTQPTPSANNFYIGTNQLNDAGSTIGITPVSNDTGLVSAETTNFYFQNRSGVSNFPDWEKITVYILPSGFSPENAKSISSNLGVKHAIMRPDTKKLRIRVLNYGNTTTVPGTMWIAQPKVSEVPTEVINRVSIAESKVTQLADSITSKVSKTDYNGNTVTSMINQTATTIKLKAENIELLGITTVAQTLYIGGTWQDSNFKSIEFRGDSGGAAITSSSIDSIEVFGMANATMMGLGFTALGADYVASGSGVELVTSRETEVHGRERLSLHSGNDELKMTGNKNITFNEEVIAIGSSRVLWTGSIFLQASQIITPSRTLSECPNGWILVWSRYVNSAPANSDWNFTYIPKEYPSQAGSSGMWAPLVAANVSADTPPMAFKYVYPNNTRVMGHDRNRSGNESGQVLRAILAY